jgi:hypothetical protein
MAHAIMGINTPHIFLQPLAGNVGYKTEDVNVVYIFQLTPYALIVPNDSPIKDLDDYIARAKAAPGTITVAGTGTNSAPHVAQESFDHFSVSRPRTCHLPVRRLPPPRCWAARSRRSGGSRRWACSKGGSGASAGRGHG